MTASLRGSAQAGAVATRAVCCACHQQCGVLVDVRDGRVNRISGDKQHPISAGFICTKGMRAHELQAHPDRILHPLKRIGARGSGRWARVGWDEALDAIAGTISNLTAAHGRETLAYTFGTFHGADWGIGQRFMNLFGSPNSAGQDKICYGPAALGEALTYGYGPSFMSRPVPGVTRCMVVWGFRPSGSGPLMWREILRTQRAGAKLIVIDPMQTTEARAADLWLQCLPGTDLPLALGLLHCVVVERHYDAAVVASQTLGFDALRAVVQHYTPDRVAQLTGVPAELITAAARMYAAHSPAIIHAGNGVCQSGPPAVQIGRALACLVAITGNLGAAGGHGLAGPPRDLIANGAAMADAALPAAQVEKRLGADRYPPLSTRFSALDVPMSRRWYGQRGLMGWLTTAHEPALWRAIATRKPYAITALVVQHHNPVGASANCTAAAAALGSEHLELLVAHDLFLNATSSLADYVLPAAHWLEKPFLSMGLGSLGVAGDYVEAKHAVLGPPGECRSDYDLWHGLAHRLGQATQWPTTAAEFWAGCLAPAELEFDAVCANLGPLMGSAARRQAQDTVEPAVGFGTPSGQIELYSSVLEAWECDPLPGFAPADAAHAVLAEFPYVLTTGGRSIDGFHQEAQQMPGYRRKHAEPFVSLHPDLGLSLGIADGGWLWLETPIGRIRQRARYDSDLAANVVHAERWWFPERAHDRADPFGWRSTNVNVCTDDSPERCDPILGSWSLRGLPCRLQPAEEPARAPMPERLASAGRGRVPAP